MKTKFVTVGTLCIAGALALPGGAIANDGDAAVQIAVKASADTATAQQLARSAPKRAYAFLRRSRSELAAAYGKASADSETRAGAMTDRLRKDAQSMRNLARSSSGAMSVAAANAVRVDIQMQAGLAGQMPAEQRPVVAAAAADMTHTALRGLHATPARAHKVRRAFARAVAAGLELGRSIARGAAADAGASQSESSDLIAQVMTWVSSVRGQLQASDEGSTPVSGTITLSVLADQVVSETSWQSSLVSGGTTGQVAPGWTAIVQP
jgi:hypothetical protein